MTQSNSVDPLEPVIEKLTPPRHIVDLAIEVSTWSPCRSKRGVVIFSGDDVLSHGHNSKPSGFECDGSEACKATCRREAVHAEQRALLNLRSPATCEMLHVKTVDGALVPSGGPSCVECSKLLVAARVTAAWLYHEHGWQRYVMAEFHRLSLSALLGVDRQGWQAIETAPKDGTPVRLKWHGTTVEATGHWVRGTRATGGHVPDDWRDVEGNDLLMLPTHWMALSPGVDRQERRRGQEKDLSHVDSLTQSNLGATGGQNELASTDYRWLDDIEAQIDSTVPYYVPRLCQEIRHLERVIQLLRKDVAHGVR